VAHSLSAKKRVRQSIKRRARNRQRKELIKDSQKAFTAAIAGGALDKAPALLNEAVKRLDKVAAKGTIHKNTAARRRSRLTRRLNAARQAAATGGGKPTKGATGRNAE
jgi:small subunit ribosomal protein S20